MSTTATAPVTSLLTGIGIDADALRKACDELEFEIEEFNSWQNGNNAAPVMGCAVCFRVPDEEEVAA
jgi:hypothetical protein